MCVRNTESISSRMWRNLEEEQKMQQRSDRNHENSDFNNNSVCEIIYLQNVGVTPNLSNKIYLRIIHSGQIWSHSEWSIVYLKSLANMILISSKKICKNISLLSCSIVYGYKIIIYKSIINMKLGVSQTYLLRMYR